MSRARTLLAIALPLLLAAYPARGADHQPPFVLTSTGHYSLRPHGPAPRSVHLRISNGAISRQQNLSPQGNGTFVASVTCPFSGPGILEATDASSGKVLESLPVYCGNTDAALASPTGAAATLPTIVAQGLTATAKTVDAYAVGAVVDMTRTTTVNGATSTSRNLEEFDGVQDCHKTFFDGILQSSFCAPRAPFRNLVFLSTKTLDLSQQTTVLYKVAGYSYDGSMSDTVRERREVTLGFPDLQPGQGLATLRIENPSTFVATRPFSNFDLLTTDGSGQRAAASGIVTTEPLQVDDCSSGTSGIQWQWRLSNPVLSPDGTITLGMDPQSTCPFSTTKVSETPGTKTTTVRQGANSALQLSSVLGSGDVAALDQYKIRLAAFMPGNYAEAAPLMSSCLASQTGMSSNLLERGDDRLAVDPGGSASFRLQQRVVVIPNAAADADGLVNGTTPINAVGLTREYASDALTNGAAKVDDGDDDSMLFDCHLLERRDRASNSGMQVQVTRTGPQSVEARLQARVGDPSYPLSHLGGPLQWNLTVTIDESSGRPLVSVSGEHGEFPAFELFVNDKLVYSHLPAPAARIDPPPPHHSAADALWGLLWFRTTPVDVSDLAL